MERKTYVCKKLFLYNLLTSRGFVPFKVAPDKYNCKKTIWLYDETPALRDVVEEYYNRNKAREGAEYGIVERHS